jgi:vacuolar-type H+-ATPase subunit H
MKSVIDCATGEITKVDLDKVSKDQQKIDEADYKAAEIIRKAEAEAKATAKAAILDRIGLTVDELQTILG